MEVKKAMVGSGLFANIGCGGKYHKDWWNCDYSPRDNSVVQCDVTKGVPLPDGACAVVYHAHVLEHLTEMQGKSFLAECYRLLRPQGVIRVVVPDLEGIARAYLEALEKLDAGHKQAADNHRWMVLELLDQCVREKQGGEIVEYLCREHIPNEEFVVSRLGEEARGIIRRWKLQSSGKADVWKLSTRLRLAVTRYIKSLGHLRFALLTPIERQAYRIGSFRMSGEIHRHMYDRVSLCNALTYVGFEGVLVRDFKTSYVENWSSFQLDSTDDSAPRKPDSLYMEARKPSQG